MKLRFFIVSFRQIPVAQIQLFTQLICLRVLVQQYASAYQDHDQTYAADADRYHEKRTFFLFGLSSCVSKIGSAAGAEPYSLLHRPFTIRTDHDSLTFLDQLS